FILSAPPSVPVSTLSLHDALPIFFAVLVWPGRPDTAADPVASYEGIIAEYVRNVSLKVGESAIIHGARGNECGPAPSWESAKLLDRKSTRLNSSHVKTSYAVLCLK